MAIFKKKKPTKRNTRKQPSKGVSGPYSMSSSSGSSGTTWGTSTSSATYPHQPIMTSGAVWGSSPYEEERRNIDLNNTDFTFKLLDGTQKILSAKEYFDFIAYNQMTPGDCKDEKEYLEKVMAIKL